MAQQKIQTIKVSDLRLWSENPRDPVDVNSADDDILKQALEGNPAKWNLQKMLQEMGSYYDLSELPTVVYVDGKPVVYDGNRRVAVLKYVQNESLYSALGGGLFFKFEPKELKELTEIPCNVCDKETALTNIERKHSANGSWGTLEREYFLDVHMGQPKSIFLRLEEQTNLITDNPSLNKRFVKDEVLTKKKLNEIGFDVNETEGIVSSYTPEDAKEILDKIPALVESKSLTTRTNRGELKKLLEAEFPALKGKLKPFDTAKLNKPLVLQGVKPSAGARRTPSTKKSDILFGKPLALESGQVNDLYRVLVDIDGKYKANKDVYLFMGMALRLLIEVAARVYYTNNSLPATASKDQISTLFLKLAKKQMNQATKNYVSLTANWLSDKYNFDAILDKYAHGNMTATRSSIVEDSVIAADILEYYFGK